MNTWNDLRKHLPDSTSRQSKDLRNRVNQFIEWAIANGLTPEQVKLAAYRLYLIDKGYSPTSIKAHLSSVRGWIKGLIKLGLLQQYFLERLNADLTQENVETIVSQKIGQVLQALTNEVELKKLPEVSRRNLQLNDDSVNELLQSLRPDTLTGKRDAAVIVTLLATGVRKEELVEIQVAELRHTLNDMSSLRIAADNRLVPYLPDAFWCLDIIEHWLKAANITEGPVFRGIYKSGNMMREGKLSPSTVERILANYPIHHEGQIIPLKPLDLRHVYASHLFRSRNVSFDELKSYLGIKTNDTVLEYLGRAINPELVTYSPYTFDLSRLNS